MKQMRGVKLEEFLVAQLRAWFNATKDAGESFRYSQLAFSNKVGVSRETVRKKQDVLDVVLQELCVERKIKDGRRSRLDDDKRLERIKSELDLLKNKYGNLQKYHVRVFSVLYRLGVDLRSYGIDNFDCVLDSSEIPD